MLNSARMISAITLGTLFLFGSRASAVVNITATKTVALQTDVNGNGIANPGDTLKYRIIITNTGTTDATGVVLNDVLDPNVTLVAGSVHAQPISLGESYTPSATPSSMSERPRRRASPLS